MDSVDAIFSIFIYIRILHEIIFSDIYMFGKQKDSILIYISWTDINIGVIFENLETVVMQRLIL